ncbi:MAG: DnaB-like helicase C-terminal domain-containing protein, partial [Flavobacteriia bacterium]
MAHVFVLVYGLKWWSANKQELMEDRFRSQLKRIIERSDADGKLVFDEVRQLVQEYESTHVEPDLDRTMSLNSLFVDQLIFSKVLDKDVGVISGFPEMDKEGTFSLGEYVVIGGRPAMGKTQLLVNLALNMSVHVPVLYLSYDLSDSAVLKRMIANLTGIPLIRLSSGDMNDLEKKLIASMEKEFSARKLLINDSAYSNVTHVKELCRKHIEREG